MTDQESFTDVFFVQDPFPTISFRTGLTVYEESLIRGQYVGRGWNASGYIHPEGVRLNPADHPTPQAFWIEVDGQLLHSHWEWQGLTQDECEDKLHITVALKHAVRPISVSVHTLLDGTPVLTRWLEITNTSDRPAALSAAYPWSGVLLSPASRRAHQPDAEGSLYSVGYMIDTHHGAEGDFEWRRLPNAAYRIDGRYRRERHRHPMFVLRNEMTGEHFIGQLAWSGGYAFEFDLDAGPGTPDDTARLFFRAGPDAPPPLRVIGPGETVATPEMHLGMVIGDLDAAVQAMHDHLRRSVFLPQPRGRGCWVESAVGPEQEITPEIVYHEVDTAAEIGAEVFFIDASWYSAPHTNWSETLGDWQVGSRFPDGLKPFRDYVHNKGMLFGLWMDAERIGKSEAAREHPEWCARRYDGEALPRNMLDLTQPEAARWMEEQICRVISEHELDFFRLDYNIGNIGNVGPGGQNIRDGFVENTYWRYYETLYAIYERVRQRFPKVILENCASGGGRTDIGMIRRFSHTWVTDWQIAPRSFSITNGMTIALPPEYVDRLLGGQGGHRTADIDFQARLLLFVRPTVGGLCPIGVQRNPLQISRVKHMVDLYKNFVRSFQPTSRIFHHTPTVSGREPRGYGVLELAARDRSRAIAGVFQLGGSAEPEYLLRFRGLDMGQRYQLTSDNTGQVRLTDGFQLMKEGVPVRLETPLTSELLLCEEVE